MDGYEFPIAATMASAYLAWPVVFGWKLAVGFRRLNPVSQEELVSQRPRPANFVGMSTYFTSVPFAAFARTALRSTATVFSHAASSLATPWQVVVNFVPKSFG